MCVSDQVCRSQKSQLGPTLREIWTRERDRGGRRAIARPHRCRPAALRQVHPQRTLRHWTVDQYKLQTAKMASAATVPSPPRQRVLTFAERQELSEEFGTRQERAQARELERVLKEKAAALAAREQELKALKKAAIKQRLAENMATGQ